MNERPYSMQLYTLRENLTANLAATLERRASMGLARSLRDGIPERAAGSLAYHVLDVLLGLREAAQSDVAVTIASTAAPPVPLDEKWDPTVVTL